MNESAYIEVVAERSETVRRLRVRVDELETQVTSLKRELGLFTCAELPKGRRSVSRSGCIRESIHSGLHENSLKEHWHPMCADGKIVKSVR
jgi:hypothetical protein